jgi:hypothetical protein
MTIIAAPAVETLFNKEFEEFKLMPIPANPPIIRATAAVVKATALRTKGNLASAGRLLGKFTGDTPILSFILFDISVIGIFISFLLSINRFLNKQSNKIN